MTEFDNLKDILTIHAEATEKTSCYPKKKMIKRCHETVLRATYLSIFKTGCCDLQCYSAYSTCAGLKIKQFGGGFKTKWYM